VQTGLDSRPSRVGLAAALTRGQLRARPPKLNHLQQRHSLGLYWTARYTVREIGALFTVFRSTVSRAVRRADRTADSDAAHSAGEPAPGMQTTLPTVAETADVFTLGPLIVVNLHCIPTGFVVEMQPRLRNRGLFLEKSRSPDGPTSPRI